MQEDQDIAITQTPKKPKLELMAVSKPTEVEKPNA